MNHALRSLIFVAILGSFGNYCVAAQAAQPLQVKNLKIRNGELRSRFEAVQILPLAEQDQAAIKAIKDDSNAYLQEAQSKTNSNTKRLVEELNAEIMKQWPEPKKPGLFSRAGGWLKSAAASTAQKTKDLAGSGLATLGNGVKSTASKAASKLQYHLFEEGEITRAEIELETRRKNLADQEHPNAQEIEQLRQDVDALQKRATAWYGHLHMPIEELRIRAQSLAIPAPRTRVLQTQENVRELIQQDIFTVGQAPAAPAPLRIIVTNEQGQSAHYEEPRPSVAPAHDAGNAQPEPQAIETTPLTAEERAKQNQELLAQAQKIIADHEKAHKAEQAHAPATAVNSGSMSMVAHGTPKYQAPAPEPIALAKKLIDHLTKYYENGTIEHLPSNVSLTTLHKTLPSILGALRNHPESLETLARICFENREKSREEFERIITLTPAFEQEVTSVCNGFAYANTESAALAEAEKMAAHKEAVHLFYSYAKKLNASEEQLRQEQEERELKADVSEKRDANDRVEAPADKPAAEAPGSKRGAALLAYLKDLHDIDQNITRKRVRKAVIDYFEDHTAELNTIAHAIETNKHLPNDDIITAIQQLDAYNSFNRNCFARLAQQADLRLNQNPIVAGRQNFFKAAIKSGKSFRPVLPRKKASSWLKNVGIGSLVGGTAYGLYGLSKMYAGTTKSMIGYQSMSSIGSKLPALWKGINALTFKVVLPAVGIAAAGVICYACYRFYVHKKLSDQLAADKARSASDDCTQEELEAMIKRKSKANREAIRTAGEILEAGEAIEAITGTNPVQDHIDKELGLQV